MQDLVTVIMPAYNVERYIGEAIESVLKQTYSNFELIIVDDGSTDATKKIISSYIKDPRVKLLERSVNRGVAEARNTALSDAKGRWVAPIDADDVWLPERLERLIGILGEAGEDKYFVADDHIVCFDSKSGLKRWKSSLHSYYKTNFYADVITLSFLDYLRYNTPLMHPIYPLTKVKVNKLIYKEELVSGEDFEFYCELFRVGLKLKLTKSAYYLYRLTTGSLSSRKPSNSITDAIEYLLSLNGFSDQGKESLKKFLILAENSKEYNTFTYYIKNNHLYNAAKIILEHPALIFRFIHRTSYYVEKYIAYKRSTK